MHTITIERGRLCNQIIRNLCVSIIAKKNDLYVEYSQYNKITSMGIELYIGSKKYDKKKILNDDNYFDILNLQNCDFNLDPNSAYFQTKLITNYLYNHLNSYDNRNMIINKNPFSYRYNNNNDCVIHIRLNDASKYCPLYEYFSGILDNIKYNKLYIATDDTKHDIILKFLSEKNSEIISYDDVKTLQFASTCKNVILSHGTYSAVMGYLAFYSNVYYTVLDEKNLWHGDIFSINSNNWIKI